MESIDRDLIVVGAGGCGLMAALVAARKGARVLVLEKTDKPGGGTAFLPRGFAPPAAAGSVNSTSTITRRFTQKIFPGATMARAAPSSHGGWPRPRGEWRTF